MATKHAQTLTDKQFDALAAKVLAAPNGVRNRAMLMLSFKAGLRAQEIAGLSWGDVCDAEGAIGKPKTTYVDDLEMVSRNLFVPGSIAKYGKERFIPINKPLMEALTALYMLRLPRPQKSPVIVGHDGDRMTPDAVRKWFHRLYERNGLEGCSSHSGRRTLITKLARAANARQCSLRDVQAIAGHSSISTTEKYIEVSPMMTNLMDAA